MSWITVDYKNSGPTLKKIYDRVKGPDDKVDNILQVHSLRPHTLVGHMGLYKNVLHNRNNTIPRWFLESLGIYVSMLNKCNYCIEHHFEGLRKLIQNDTKANRIKAAFEDNTPEELFDDKELAALRYAEKLTLKPSSVREKDIDVLKISKFDDGEILEINQVVSYFSYANRMVLGLGVDTKGDTLGLSPKDENDADNWSHI